MAASTGQKLKKLKKNPWATLKKNNNNKRKTKRKRYMEKWPELGTHAKPKKMKC